MTEPLNQAQLQTQSRLIPRIYADGENDDLVGFAAAVENKLVLYDGVLYAPDESIEIDGRTMVLSQPIYIYGEGHEPDPDPFDGQPYVTAIEPAQSKRRLRISNSFIELRLVEKPESGSVDNPK